jgi:hypothetical protein
MLLFCGGSLLCGSVMGVVIDRVCMDNANAWIPQYPGSTVISESHTFLNVFGMGITRMQLKSDDPANKVKRWYLDLHGKVSLENRPFTQLAAMGYGVSEDKQNGGSLISLTSDCSWS